MTIKKKKKKKKKKRETITKFDHPKVYECLKIELSHSLTD